ncbi:hypothetical protein C6496_13975 [Candidatus Poribacteria bacterium]|nr:MAG: hypothetical protein C6496_13975 [Candidatus Poribacteria bacterium]
MRKSFLNIAFPSFLIVCLTVIIFITVGISNYDQDREEAKDNWAITTDGALSNAITKLNKLIAQRNLLHALYTVNMHEIQDSVLDLLPGAVTADPVSATAESIKNVIKLGQKKITESHLRGLFTQSVGEVGEQHRETNRLANLNNEAYNAYKTETEKHNQSSFHKNKPSSHHTVLPKTPRDYEVESLTLPDPSKIFCLGGCGMKGDREWGTVRDRDGKVRHVSTTRPFGAALRGYEIVTIAAHKEQCGVRAKYRLEEHSSNWFWSEKICEEYYYKCNSGNTCPNAENHLDDDDDDDDSTEQDTEGLQTEETQTSTPSYHTCGVHEASVSGTHSAAGCGVSGHYVCDGSDHSLQASCTTTNASGQYCTVSSFYACQSHTHVYPSGNNGNNDNGNGNTEVTCSHCSNTYDTTNSGDYIYHNNTATCNRLGCGVTFITCEYYTNLCQSPDHQYHSY